MTGQAIHPPPGIMRILVVFHEAELLGAGRSVLQAAEALREYGWSLSGWIPGEGPLVPAAAEKLSTVESHDRPMAFSKRGWREHPGVRDRLRRTPGYLRALRSMLLRVRPHVVHANTLLTLPEACVARRLGLPVVMQVHELPPKTLKRRAVIEIASRAADVFVAVSDAANTMLRDQVHRVPIITVHSGAPARASSARTRRHGAFTVGTIGTISRLKGTDVFLRAAALALQERPSLRFEHAGQPNLHHDEGLDAEVASLLASDPLRSAVTMLGRQPGEDLLPSWDVFVLTSRSEAFPLTVLEAMAAGVPVIATRVGGVPEQVQHLESGVLVAPDDPPALARWIVQMHDDPELRNRLGDEAVRRARTRFPLERQAQGLHGAYLMALNRRFGPPPVRDAAHVA
jgi:glycosyltransferase involved in cell wall biosynthesis